MILTKNFFFFCYFAKLREQSPLIRPDCLKEKSEKYAVVLSRLPPIIYRQRIKMISYPVKSSSCVEGAWPFIHAREDRTASLLFVLFRCVAFTRTDRRPTTVRQRSQNQVNGHSTATVYFILSCARFRKSRREPIDNCHLSRRLGFRLTNYTQKADKKLWCVLKEETWNKK